MEQLYLPEHYVTVTPGEPIRLLPLGKLVKGGQIREITRELLAKFKLPHFRPAIKLGSHDDETPAGGHITGLEVRDDGLYADVEYTEKGTAAIEEGDYRYHSPEVVWEGGFEDPDTGELIEGPLIVGDALLHTPHLGESAALYSVEDPILHDGGVTMTDTVTVPVSWLDKFLGRNSEPQPEPEPQPPDVTGVEPDQLEALETERDDLAAKLATMEAQANRAGRVAHFAAELKETVLDEDEEVHELLAELDDEATAEALLVKFKALSGQVVASNLTGDIGNAGEPEGTDPDEALNAAILAKVKEDGIDYNAALGLVRDEQPDLFSHLKGGK
jgi:hypothetical protein